MLELASEPVRSAQGLAIDVPVLSVAEKFSVGEEEFVVCGESRSHDLVHSDLGFLDLFFDRGLVLLLNDLLLFIRFP